MKRLAGVLLEGISLGTLDPQVFAPATGYISFFTLSLYVAGLILVCSVAGSDPHIEAQRIVAAYRDLPHGERRLVREGIGRDQKLITSAEE